MPSSILSFTPYRGVGHGIDEASSALVHERPGNSFSVLHSEAGRFLCGAVLRPRETKRDACFHDTQTGEIALVLGSVFNADVLKKQLGVPIAGGIDTPEIMLLAYRKWGRDCFRHIYGNFSTIIISAGGCVSAARDHLGTMPLYHARTGAGLVVSSDMRLILSMPKLDQTLDDLAVAEFLIDEYLSLSRTFYRSVSRVRPGCSIQFEGSETSEKRYWFPPHGNHELSYREAKECLQTALSTAVRRALPDQGASIVQLSGGLDSSSVAVVAEEVSANRGGKPVVELFSGIFPEAGCDESSYFLEVSNSMTLPLYVWRLEGPGWPTDQPIDPVQPLRTWKSDLQYGMNERMASTGAGTALSGVGADELLAEIGYMTDLFRDRQWRALREQCRSQGRSLVALSRFAAREFLKETLPTAAVTWIRRIKSPGSGHLPGLLSPDLARALVASEETASDGLRFRNDVQANTWRRLTSPRFSRTLELLQDEALRNGRNCKFSFLDRELVEFILGLDYSLRLPYGGLKRLLRDSFSSRLPRRVVNRNNLSDYRGLYIWQISGNRDKFLSFFRNNDLRCEHYMNGKVAGGLVETLRTAHTGSPAALPLRKILELELWLRKI